MVGANVTVSIMCLSSRKCKDPNSQLLELDHLFQDEDNYFFG
jgi:hypothetical protein